MIEQLFRVRCEGCGGYLTFDGLTDFTSSRALITRTFAGARSLAVANGWGLGPVQCPNCRPAEDGDDETPHDAIGQAKELGRQAMAVIEEGLPRP